MTLFEVWPADRPRRPGRGRHARMIMLGGALIILVVALAAGTRGWLVRAGSRAVAPSWAPVVKQSHGLRAIATASTTRYSLYTARGPVHFLPGVDLGATTPGHLPGELAITPGDYKRWLNEMSGLGIRAVRIYTIQPPAFYRALAAHDTAHPGDPIYLVQGVYLPNDIYLRKQNLYDPAATRPFTQELRDAVAAVNGKLVRSPRHGFASGTWTANVSRWTAGWIIGVEWDPLATAATNRRNPHAPAVHGRYFYSTPDASPAERWLAARMNDLATAEAATGWTAPVAFVNWPTADPLRHPGEPNPQEDMVGVDAAHVLPTSNWPGGTFASFHAYPYYPDFLRYQPSLQHYVLDGRADPYAAYLHDLLMHFNGVMPVMITEFGVPSSLGSAHSGVLGWGQGDHTERQSMVIDARLLRMMRQLGMAGGFVFEWTDEWYKQTWNTQFHQVPSGRVQLWHDVFTNEQFFGIVATDPLPLAPSRVIYRGPGTAPVRQVTAWEDESYIHLRLWFTRHPAGNVTVGLDTIPADLGPPPPGSADRRAGYALVLDLSRHTGQAWVRTKLDPDQIDSPPVLADAGRVPRDGWRRLELVTDRPMVLPLTHMRTRTEFQNVGLLREGDWNPGAPGYDSLALWHVRGMELDLRIPWAMAGMSDPSSHQALIPRGLDRSTSVTIPGIGVTVAMGAGGATGASGASSATQQVGTVTWPDWEAVRYTERIKPGAAILRQAFDATGRR